MSEVHTHLDPMYELVVFSGREITDTGLLELGELMHKGSQNKVFPSFRFRWDEKSNTLDIDSTHASKTEIEKFRKGTSEYRGHHTKPVITSPRAFEADIVWRGQQIYRGSIGFNLEFDVLCTDRVGISASTSYSVSEASKLSKLSPQHIRHLLANGMMLGKKLGHDWVVMSLDYKRKRKPKRSNKLAIEQT